ncbi:MAP kinase-activated protein kinase 2 (Fragment) [Seminavis robusta]|uniref:MAP kinase-activated protein kinase 2 n=1 Tax=Seminavis robusta TaxID=568900 RepID=A0A9N8DWX7_9STRA
MGSKGESLHDNLLREQNKNVLKKYEVLHVMGTGSMGTVSMVKVKDSKIGGSAFKAQGVVGKIMSKLLKQPSNISDTSERRKVENVYALKSIQLDRVQPLYVEELKNEINILKSTDHPNIVKAHEVYNYKKNIYLVLELCQGGDLASFSPYSEKDACRITGELSSAVKYMHDHAIVHRDLKFENIMFEVADPNSPIKVLDFGLSKKFSSGKQHHMKEGVGTIYTMAPQVLQGIYTSQCDLWSVGVIAFMLMSSEKPFADRKRRKMIDKIMRADYKMEGPIWDKMSPAGKDFVDNLLIVNPKERLNATGALAHDWLQHQNQYSDEAPSEELVMGLQNSFIAYKNTPTLKKLALNVIAHNSRTDEIMELRKLFSKYDTAKNGVISYKEFESALKESGMSDELLQDVFESIDVNNTGHINYTEFLAATIEYHGYVEEERVAAAFDRLDSDDSGFISRENLREILGHDCKEEEIDDIIKSVDQDSDGKISYQEFLKAFRSNTFAAALKIDDDESMSPAEAGNLLGLDAKIPGGKYDSEVIAKQKANN